MPGTMLFEAIVEKETIGAKLASHAISPEGKCSARETLKIICRNIEIVLALSRAYGHATDRNRRIFREHYGLNDQRERVSFTELGRRYGLSRNAVACIVRRALQEGVLPVIGDEVAFEEQLKAMDCLAEFLEVEIVFLEGRGIRLSAISI